MASLVPRALVFCALFLLAAFAVSAAVVPPGGKLLARSEFHWDNDGWKGYSKRRVVRVDVDMGQLRASDDDDSIWFFSAPASFLGDKSEAFGGTLSFTVGHSEYNSLGLGNQEECDIILESVATNISLCHRKVIPPWVTSSENVVELSDDGGWEHTETSEPASRLAVLRCLSSLSALHIRGSHYFGHEHSYIKDVSLSKGVRQDLAWIRNDPYIDELCASMKLPIFACEEFGVHVAKYMQKLSLTKLRSEASSRRKAEDL